MPRTIESEWRKITPKQAEELLEQNAVNRKLRPRLVECYAEDMVEGLWNPTGEAIKISRTGRLLDGQHRLSAIIASGKTVELLVVTGLPDETQKLMDQGAARTANDALALAGVTNAHLTGAVARWQLLVPEPGPGMDQLLKKKASTARIVKVVEAHPDIPLAAAKYNGLRNHIPGSPTAVAYSWLHMHRMEPGDCEMFYGAMVEMAFKALHDPRKAALKALQRMEREDGITTASKDKALATVSVLTRSWNAWRKGEELETVAIRHKGKIVPPVKPI